jgi:hypothetical protein
LVQLVALTDGLLHQLVNKGHVHTTGESTERHKALCLCSRFWEGSLLPFLLGTILIKEATKTKDILIVQIPTVEAQKESITAGQTALSAVREWSHEQPEKADIKGKSSMGAANFHAAKG